MLALTDFGQRIMICGPSNSGKSTLAVAIGQKLGLPALHIDQFRHLPKTDWVQRPDAEFYRLHDEAILGDAWVIEGNYTKLVPQRLARATGIILLGDNRWANLWRYFRRSLTQRDRPGALDGAKDSIKWEMIRWIVVVSPKNLRRYRIDLPASGLPFLEVRSMGELRRLYAIWSLPFGGVSPKSELAGPK
jgi:adenylate kinase family enzyme